MRGLTNWVAIKLDADYNMTKSGLHIPEMEETKGIHAPVTGTVVVVPEKLVFNQHKIEQLRKHRENSSTATQRIIHELTKTSINAGTEIEIEKGDKVWIKYQEAFRDDRNIDGLTIVRYDSIYCVKRGEEIIMPNGYLLVEPLTEEKHFLEIEAKESKNLGVVKVVGKPVSGYLGYPHVHDVDEIKVEYKVMYNSAYKIPLEYDLHRRLDGKKYLVMHRKEILAYEN